MTMHLQAVCSGGYRMFSCRYFGAENSYRILEHFHQWPFNFSQIKKPAFS